MKKICFKCNSEQPLSEFYTHKKMADGHVNKCKGCCKKEAAKREKKLRKDPAFVQSERERAREKYKKNDRFKKKIKPNRSLANKSYNERFPEKRMAHSKSQYIVIKIEGNQLHHWSYNPKDQKDIIEVSPEQHYAIHRIMVYDQERMMYRRSDNNELLDTKERHIEYINQSLHFNL